MLNFDKFKSKKDYLKPKRFFDELAELGYLEEFLNTRLKDIYDNDEQFKREMLEILYQRSPNPVDIVDVFYLEKLCENLEFFLEYTKQWRIPKQ